MKKVIKRTLGVGLTLVFALTLALGMTVPAAAADYEENDWGEWGMPAIEPMIDIGDIVVAPDGTIFAAVYDDDSGDWMVQKSEDGGFEWDDTELDDANGEIAQLVVSPNYDDDETIYVGVRQDWSSGEPVVYRLEDAGDANPIALKTITDSAAVDATELWSLDVMYDGDENWILVGTNVDALVLEDAPFGTWIDQELDTAVFEVRFAPDFDDSELIWAVTDDFVTWSGDFLVTSTVAPGQWGQVIEPAIIDCSSGMWLDLAFPDDYTSDVQDETPVVFAAVTGDEGGVYFIEFVEADGDAGTADSVATQVMDDEDMVSIDISGEIILAGAMWSPEIYISDDLGASWDDVTKSPTGEGWTHVVMAPGAFDPDDGEAYAATWGEESAFSVSMDGGEVWTGAGLIDTYIDNIEWLAFHPDFPDTPTFMMVTDNWTGPWSTDSLWVTYNGDVDEPDYHRILCGEDSGTVGNFGDNFDMVDWSWDGDVIYLSGYDDNDDSLIWKSTNDGDTFGSQRSVPIPNSEYITNWEIVDSSTIYAVSDNDQVGFLRTSNSGLSWQTVDLGPDGGNDIALSPDFDNDEFIMIGSDGGRIFISDNGGDSFDDIDAGLDGDVWVAFGPDFEDAQGLIYGCGYDTDVFVGEADGDEVDDWEELEDDQNEDRLQDAFDVIDCGGLVVSEDNVLYAIDWDSGLYRLILDEDNSVWERALDGDLTDPWFLWMTPGSNVLWTIDFDDDEIWVLEDTLSGQVTLDSPADGYRSDHENRITLEWDELRGADDEYEYKLTADLAATVNDQTDDLDVTVTTLDAGTEYTWKVRVAPGNPWHSRWSDKRTFHTALGAPPWAPDLYAPANGADSVLLSPAFSWETATSADGYEFMLASDPGFASVISSETVSDDAFTPTVTLDYSMTYYWKVRALKGNDAISRWSEVSVFTTMGAPPEPPDPPPPPPDYPDPVPPAPWQEQMPVYAWTIIGVGLLLVIVVIVLIWRTRRPA